MMHTGWSWIRGGKAFKISLILIFLFSYSVVLYTFVANAKLPVPLLSHLQIFLSIIYFFSGILAFYRFLQRKNRVLYGLMSLFCVLPSLHLFTTSGIIFDVEIARFFYIYFANISFYFLFCLFSAYLFERFRTGLQVSQKDNLAMSLYLSLSLVFVTFFDFFIDFHYLEKFDYTDQTFYQPLYKADLKLVGGIVIILFIALYFLVKIIKKSKRKGFDRVYIFFWSYAFALGFVESYDLYTGFRSIHFESNFPIILFTYIVVNIYLLVFLIIQTFKGFVPLRKESSTLKGRIMKKIKPEKNMWGKFALALENEKFRRNFILFLLIIIACSLASARFIVNPFLVQTIAMFAALVLFFYAFVFPFLVDISSPKSSR